MLTKQNSLLNLRKSWSFILFGVAGSILNLFALLTDDNGALVAVGCSLIAIGIAINSKSKSDS